MQTILNQGNDFDWFGWSWFLFGLLVMVIVALPCFVIWELGERHPAINLRLFAYRNYSVAVICSVLGFLVILRTVVSLRRAAPIIAWLFLFACRPRLPIYDPPFRAARRDHPRVVPEISTFA